MTGPFDWSSITLGQVRARQAAREARLRGPIIDRWKWRVIIALEIFILYQVMKTGTNLLQTVACSYLTCGAPEIW